MRREFAVRPVLLEAIIAPGLHAVELSSDERFAGRIRRLARTASVALGLILALALRTRPDASWVVFGGLALGWFLMPLILWRSLRRPRLRYALVLPSLLIGLPLLWLSLTTPPTPDWQLSIGWWSLTAGIWLGSLLGTWFWYHLLPVPGWLRDPYSRGRWSLIIAHIMLIVVGALLLLPLAT